MESEKYVSLGIAVDSNDASPCATPTVSSRPAKLDASKLVKNLVPSSDLKTLPGLEDSWVPMAMDTDHMLIVNYDPIEGWSAPEIKAYDSFKFVPASSCYHYAPNCFEGMKATNGPDGEPRLFRPLMNCERMLNSALRIDLPAFDPSELLKLIKEFVLTEARWILPGPDRCIYIRPAMVGTSTYLAPQSSDSATLFIFIRPSVSCLTSRVLPVSGASSSLDPTKVTPISLLALKCAWLSETCGYKISGNYAPAFLAKRKAAKEGFSQVLWLGHNDTVTEAGESNFFVVVKHEKMIKDADKDQEHEVDKADSQALPKVEDHLNGTESRSSEDIEELDIITPPLDGHILPGIVRHSCLDLLRAHATCEDALPSLRSLRLHVCERQLTLFELLTHTYCGTLVEAFCTGTAVGVAPVGKIAWDVNENDRTSIEIKGPGKVRNALFERLEEIRREQPNWKGWTVRCDASDE